MNGAQLLARTLKAAGNDLIFSLSGNQILPIYDACLDEGLRIIDTRHEAAAAHMADAYARLSGRPAICLVTAGPGHTNALSAIGNALLAESPVLFLSGGSELAQDGRGAFQELDQPGIAAPVCKAALRARPDQPLPDLLARTYRLMLRGRPGPVHLTLPADVLAAEAAAAGRLPDRTAFEPPRPAAQTALVERALEWLLDAERPLVLGGPSQAWGEPGQAFSRFLGASGLPGFVLESPRALSDPALHGVGPRFREADAVLLLAPQDYATGFAAPTALAEGGRLIQVAADDAELGPNRQPDLGLVGDPTVVASQLLDALASPVRKRSSNRAAARAAWAADLAKSRAAHRSRLADAEHSEESPLHPLMVCAEVRQHLRQGDVAAIDGGEFGQWARWALGGGQQRILLNGKLGMIGPSLPFALAGRLAAPDARVVAFLGDGTFGFHGFEFDTAVRHHLPFVAIVGNDTVWAAEYHRQVAIYGRDRLVASELLPTRYDEVARALGAAGELVERPEQLRPALQRAFASDRPTCLNVRIASVPSPAAAAA